MRSAIPRAVSAGVRPLEFLKGFLRNPKEVGSLVPSSRFLTRRVLACGEFERARGVVELGPGTGVLTGEILRRLDREARLVAIEINSRFARMLRDAYPDPRLVVHEGSAVELEQAVASARIDEVDVVVSGIPFSTLDRGTGRATLEAARRILAPGGRFLAYQFRSHVRRVAEPLFGPGLIEHEFWNLPPMRVFVWRKREFD